MIENSCFECDYYKENWCRIFGYYFKLYVAKKTTCERYKEKEPAILLRSDPTLVDRMRDKERERYPSLTEEELQKRLKKELEQ